MKYFVSNNNLGNSDIEFEDERERELVRYYVYDEDTIKNNPSISHNYNLVDCKILAVKLNENSEEAAKEMGPFVKKVIHRDDACINEFMRTLGIIVRSDKLDVIRLACEVAHIRYTVFDNAKDYIMFDEALADID